MTTPAPDVWTCNIADLIVRYATSAPEAVAMTAGSDRWTYARLAARTHQYARALLALGLAPGDRLVSRADKSAEALALVLGTFVAGGTYVPLNPGLTEGETRTIVEDCGAFRVIVDAPVPGVDPARMLTIADLGASADSMPTDPLPACAGGADPALMLYTSGTTGRPKGAVISHRNMTTSLTALARAWGITNKDRLLHVLPIYHGHGLFLAALCLFMAGAEVRLLGRYNLEEILANLPDCSVLMAVPTIYSRLLASEDFTKDTCSGLRLATSGSAPLPPEVFDAFLKRTGLSLLERYGSTESGMIASNPLSGPRQRGSVGQFFEGVEYRIEDQDGNLVPEGEVGRLFVKSPYIGLGYWKAGGTIAPLLNDKGYFETGDLVRVDDKGYVFIVGRDKDIIISGGFNIYPREVEIALEAVPGVAEAAVVGVPHPDFGEGVVAAVVTRPGSGLTETAIADALKSSLASYKRPKRIVIVPELPRNHMGKILKRDIKDSYAGLFVPAAQ